jgi:molybdate transport system substrate-binding protein
VTVLAAASLTGVFTDLAKTFEAEHRGVDVRLAFDSSATLATQVVQGAPADVLATADQRTMATAVDADAVQDPQVFATNTLVLVVPADNPAGITGFGDLQHPSVTYVACDEAAPCGALAKTELAANRITHPPKSLEVDVKAVLTKVSLGEADAGLVYATDARAAGDAVRTIAIPGSARHANSYPIGTVTDSDVPALAQAWVDLVESSRGRKTLASAGFGAP